MAGREVRSPHIRWGGKWKSALERLEPTEEWQELTEYAKTSAYQVARALNLGAELPEPPEGMMWEFGSIEATDKTKSTLFARLRPAE
jgi:hypothetical protein